MQESFVQIQTRLISELDDKEYRVYSALKAFVIPNVFYPSVEFLSEKLNKHRKNIYPVLASLEEKGLIYTIKNLGCTNKYKLTSNKNVTSNENVTGTSNKSVTGTSNENVTHNRFKNTFKEKEKEKEQNQLDLVDYIATSDVADVQSMPLRGLASEDLGSNSDQNNKHQQLLEILKTNCNTFGVWFSLLQAGGKYYFRHNGRMAKNHIEVGEIKRAVALLKNEGISAIEVPYSHIFNNEKVIKEVI